MRPEKKAIVAEIRGKMEGCEFVILADHRGLNAEQMKDLRVQVRDAGGLVMVVPNAMFGHAARELGWAGLEHLLIGPTAMVTGRGDISSLAKRLRAFVKANALPVVKGGRLGSRLLTAEDVEAIASLPAREVMLGRVVCTIAAPLSRLAGVMSRKVGSLMVVLNAVAEKKAGGK
jgi:large subunit ribosomal protein L10